MVNIPDVAYAKGEEYERVYHGCSQCVVAALQDAFGIRNDDIFKASTALAGGAGLAGDSGCGAYSGAILMMGHLVGRERDDFADPEGVRYKSHEMARRLRERFVEAYGTVICRDIQSKTLGRPFYLPDPDEAEKFREAGAYDHTCPMVVGRAARWAAEIILEEGLTLE